MLGALAQFAEKFPVILEEHPQDFGHAEYVLAVRNGVKDIRLQMRSELDNFLGVARGTKPAPPAAEREQVFVMAVRAAHPGEPLVQVAAFQIFADNP
ncbi:MAG: hypothetical protein Kow00111_28760 [Thermincola ferriacetica]